MVSPSFAIRRVEALRPAIQKIADGLIDDMLLLARVGRSTLRYEQVDLAIVAESVCEDLRSLDKGGALTAAAR